MFLGVYFRHNSPEQETWNKKSNAFIENIESSRCLVEYFMKLHRNVSVLYTFFYVFKTEQTELNEETFLKLSPCLVWRPTHLSYTNVWPGWLIDVFGWHSSETVNSLGSSSFHFKLGLKTFILPSLCEYGWILNKYLLSESQIWNIDILLH